MQTSLPTLLDRLKVETRPAHDRIERELDIPTRIASRTSYVGLLTRFYGFHAAWEGEVERLVADAAFFNPRRKTPLLMRDLRALGIPAGSIPAIATCRVLPHLSSPAAALGSMYVIEGSTLGGAVISRQVEQALGLEAASGCAYFRSYGRETGRMWTAFRAYLLARAQPGTEDEVVAGATRTFDSLRKWLCPHMLD